MHWPGRRRLGYACRMMILIPFLVLLLSGCPSRPAWRTERSVSMGTVMMVQLPAKTPDRVFRMAQEEIDAINGRIGRTVAGSEIQQLNERKEGVLSPETFSLLEDALAMADRTDGAFDPAIGGLTALWNIGTDQARVPSREEIAAVDTDWHHIVLDRTTRRVTLPENLCLDLGAIGKGYTADSLKTLLAEEGVTNAMLNLGGNVYAVGWKAKDTPWKVGLRDPNREEGVPFLILSVHDVSIVTSGPYERFFEQDGKRYHHILDRTTGYPAESGLASVSIIGPSSTLCDALSTSVFVLGKERGLALVASYEGYHAVLMETDGDLVFSDGFPYPYTLQE